MGPPHEGSLQLRTHGLSTPLLPSFGFAASDTYGFTLCTELDISSTGRGSPGIHGDGDSRLLSACSEASRSVRPPGLSADLVTRRGHRLALLNQHPRPETHTNSHLNLQFLIIILSLKHKQTYVLIYNIWTNSF